MCNLFIVMMNVRRRTECESYISNTLGLFGATPSSSRQTKRTMLMCDEMNNNFNSNTVFSLKKNFFYTTLFYTCLKFFV